MQHPFPPMDKAVAYRAQVARDEQFATIWWPAIQSSAPRPARFSTLPDGSYRLRVRAIDEAEGSKAIDADPCH
jgi:hypothetical protein